LMRLESNWDVNTVPGNIRTISLKTSSDPPGAVNQSWTSANFTV
jgi:hypothetical protein